MKKITRRQSIEKLCAYGMASISPAWLSLTPMQNILKRQIPGTEEYLPSVGLGTWQTFDVGENESQRDPLKDVLRTLVDQGAKVIDSSPMYGNSEAVVGDLSAELGLNDKLFMATKVWTT